MHRRRKIDCSHPARNIQRVQATQESGETLDVLVRMRIALGPRRTEIARHENAAFRVASQDVGTDAGTRDRFEHDGLAGAVDLQFIR